MKKLFLTLLFCAVTLLHPIGRAEAGVISRQQEMDMGRSYSQQIEAHYGVITDPKVAGRVERIGQSLAAVCGANDIPYSFKVLNTEDVNAMALPGGYIYVFKGLLDLMESDAEVAGVLGHELGHVVKRHVVHQIEKNMWTQMLAVFAGIASGSADAAAAGLIVADALAAGYSRADESAADREGFSYALAAGYSPYALMVSMDKLNELAKEYPDVGGGLFASHPEPEQRVKSIWKWIASLKMTPIPSEKEDGTALVTEKATGEGKNAEEDVWQFAISVSGGGNKPLYRAQLLAGGLYQVKRKGAVDLPRFIVYDRGDEADIYYDDIQIMNVYRQDVTGDFSSVGEYAKLCAAKFRQWGQIVNEKKLYLDPDTKVDPFEKSGSKRPEKKPKSDKDR